MKKRITIVEDNASIREGFSEVLDTMKFLVAIVSKIRTKDLPNEEVRYASCEYLATWLVRIANMSRVD